MKKVLPILFVASTLAFSVSPAQIRAQPTQPQTQTFDGIPFHRTPECPVQTLIFNFNRDELLQSTQLVVGAEDKAIKQDSKQALAEFAEVVGKREAMSELVDEIQKGRGDLTILGSRPTFQVQGNEATATYQLSLQNRLFNSVTQTETLKLRRDPKIREELPNWKIVPDNPETILSDANSGYLLRIATYLAYPKVMLEKVRAARSADNMRQLTIGVTGAFQDSESLILRSDNWKQAVRPFLNSEQVFHSLNYGSNLAAYSNYTFNTNLEGLSEAKLGKIAQVVGNKPSDIVLIYEGASGQLSFSHDGRAAVVFADLHVELVDVKRVKSLRWRP